MAKPKNLVAVTPGGPITDQHIVGYYTWYSISDEMKSLERVRREFRAAGLDVDRLPKSRRLADVAAEAVRKIEHGPRRNGTIVETRVEQVVNTSDEIVYQVTRHVWDMAKRQIDHPKAMRVVFEKDTGEFTFEPLDRGQEIDGLEEAILANFEANTTKIPGHKLRTILRHYIEDMGAESMRDGGAIYFLPKQVRVSKRVVEKDVNDDEIVRREVTELHGGEFLDKIRTMLTAVYGKTTMHVIECIDDAGQREYLEERFIENCETDLEEYRDELLELIATKDKRTRGFRKDLVNNLIERKLQIDERRKRFEDMLGGTIGRLDKNMELADAALQKFLTETQQPEEVAA